MAKLIDGKAVSAKVKAEAAEEVKVLKAGGITPGLSVIIVGDDPASHIYVNNKKKACAATGIHSEEYALPADTTQEELLALVKELNEKEDIHGILHFPRSHLQIQTTDQPSRSTRSSTVTGFPLQNSSHRKHPYLSQPDSSTCRKHFPSRRSSVSWKQ